MKITPELVATDPASMKVLQQLARETFKLTPRQTRWRPF